MYFQLKCFVWCCEQTTNKKKNKDGFCLHFYRYKKGWHHIEMILTLMSAISPSCLAKLSCTWCWSGPYTLAIASNAKGASLQLPPSFKADRNVSFMSSVAHFSSHSMASRSAFIVSTCTVLSNTIIETSTTDLTTQLEKSIIYIFYEINKVFEEKLPNFEWRKIQNEFRNIGSITNKGTLSI